MDNEVIGSALRLLPTRPHAPPTCVSVVRPTVRLSVCLSGQ